jgi:hypothetical protein
MTLPVNRKEGVSQVITDMYAAQFIYKQLFLKLKIKNPSDAGEVL